MTKEKFVELMDFIKGQRDKEDKLCSVLEEMSPKEYINAFIYSEYEDHLVETIRDALDLPDEDDTLEYWMYDLEFGKNFNNGDLTIDEHDIDISTADKLYDYLITAKK